jgi:hypothetical protein
MDNFNYIVSSTATQYFKTDNLVLNVFLSIFLMIAVDYIMKHNNNLLNKFINLFKKKNKSQYVIHGKITINGNSNYKDSSIYKFPIEYTSVIYMLNKLNINIQSATQYKSMSNKESRKHFFYLLDTTKDIIINKDITISAEKSRDTTKESQIIYENYYINVKSNTLTFNELRDTLTTWVKEFDNYTIENDIDSQYYFSYLGANPKEGSRENYWSIDPNSDNKEDTMNFDFYNFKSNKNFSNIFFEGKDELITRINFFLNNEKKYIALGIPYMLGLLFYGDPGCGKTSTIKAICNMTKRHLVEVPLSKIKTCRELKQIILGSRIEGKYVPQNKRIIIFEDIDCMLDILLDRDLKDKEDKESKKNKEETKEKEKEPVVIQVNTSDKAATFSTKDDNKDPLTLSFILNLIDGVHEQPGRIIIITTNYPEKLDKALIRSGRIDMKVHFKKCSSEICKQILQFYFKNNKIITSSMPDYKWSPAELMELCINNDDLTKVLSLI